MRHSDGKIIMLRKIQSNEFHENSMIHLSLVMLKLVEKIHALSAYKTQFYASAKLKLTFNNEMQF